MNNILLISEIQGYLAITTQEKLQSFDFKVISTKNDASEIDKIKDQFGNVSLVGNVILIII